MLKMMLIMLECRLRYFNEMIQTLLTVVCIDFSRTRIAARRTRFFSLKPPKHLCLQKCRVDFAYQS